jgi:hypothetical protein
MVDRRDQDRCTVVDLIGADHHEVAIMLTPLRLRRVDECSNIDALDRPGEQAHRQLARTPHDDGCRADAVVDPRAELVEQPC